MPANPTAIQYMNAITRSAKTALLAALIFTVSLLAAPAQSFQKSYIFGPGSDLTGTSLYGNARIDQSGYLSLTDTGQSQIGTFLADPFPADQAVTALTIDLSLRINQNGTKPPADGMSVNFGQNLLNASIGEDGASSGLVVTFDTFDDGGSDSAPAIEVVYDGKILDGRTFAGRTRTAVWPLAKDSSGNTLSFDTGDSFIPVTVSLSAEGKVSVIWNGTTVLSDVPVPYTPTKGWRVAVGARTGSNDESHHLQQISLSAQTIVPVLVTSEFGGQFVSPPAGSYSLVVGSTNRFTAPVFIYLDRYKNPLGTDPTQLSDAPYYRARYAGVSIDGGGINHVDDNSFQVTLTSAMTVDWQWQLEYLGAINTGTEDFNELSPSDVTDDVHANTVGNQYYGPQATIGEVFSSIVNAKVGGANSGLPVQFAAKSYVLENAPNPPERSVVFSGLNDYLYSGRTGIDWNSVSNLTLELWIRSDHSTSGGTRAPMGIGLDGAGPRLNPGFTPGGNVVLSNPNGSVQNTVTARGYVDYDWHHWAFVYDAQASMVRFYRDGIQVLEQPNTTINMKGAKDVIVIGGDQAPTPSNLSRAFPGGVNNVRIWTTARTKAQIVEGMHTPTYGEGVEGLGLEVTFDSVVGIARGVEGQLWTGTGTTNLTSVDQISNMTFTSTFSGSTLSIPADAPSTNFGLVLHSQLQVRTNDTYTFYLNSDDGSRLSIDGKVVVNNDGIHGAKEESGTAVLTAGTHDLEVLYFQAGVAEQLEVSYSSSSISKSLISEDVLLTGESASSSSTNAALFVQSTEGKGLSFEFLNADRPFPAPPLFDDEAKTVFPGFEFKEIGGTALNKVRLTDSTGRELAYALNDWTRVTWDWQKQFELVISVSAPDKNTLNQVSKLPFISGDVSLDAADSTSASQDSSLTAKVIDEWVPANAVVTVGTRYRTSNTCFQLNGIYGQLNAFGVVTMDTIIDGTYKNSVTRQYTFTNGITAPGSLTFAFGPTVFNAEIPIGEGLDASSTSAANAQLVPDLCGTNPKLLIDKNGPTVTSTPQSSSQGALTGGSGNPYIWDYVGKKFYPLQPGLYTLTWADANNSTTTYSIAINAQFPMEQVTIQNRENANGSRQGSPPDYLTTVTYPGTDSAYPASPGAHYNYVVSPNTAEPVPTAVDPDPNDRWAFQRLAFSENTSASVSASSSLFSDTTPDSRSVLVFSYRTDPNAIANGDLTQEAVAVRVVKSLDVSESQTNLSATVAARIISPLDQAGFGSGYLLYRVSNYNPQIYNPDAEVGQWGAIYPVNWSGLFQADNRRLRVAYYQNPYLASPTSTLHPNVAWPYIVANYDTVDFPGTGANMIYIASRLGSEGVNAAGADQMVFDPAKYSNLAIYNQPDRTTAGFNPNEEHALVAPSIKAQLTGNDAYNLGQGAAFALQDNLNNTNRSSASSYTSDPFVLVQYQDVASGELQMAAYKVEETRYGGGRTSLFPAMDPLTHLPTDKDGQPVPQPANPMYDFDYSGFAGGVLLPVYPLNLVVGSVTMTNNHAGNIMVNGVDQRTLWQDKNQVAWMVSGNGRFFYQNWYPMRDDFWFDFDGDGVNDVPSGTPIAWLPVGAGSQAGDYVPGNPEPQPVKARYSTYWRTDYPVLKRGETMTYVGGEYKTDHPLAQGLPGIVGWASAQLVFDSRTPAMVFNKTTGEDITGQYSARVTRPLDRFEAPMDQSTLTSAQLTPASGNVQVVRERWYFKGLTGSLQNRFYYDSLLGVLVFRGRLNDLEGGDGNLTQTPISLYALEPNVMSTNDFAALGDLPAEAGASTTPPEWTAAVTSIYTNSQNPYHVSGVISSTNLITPPVFWAGVQNPDTNAPAQYSFYTETLNPNQPGSTIVTNSGPGTSLYEHLDSLGTGAALVPNPTLLTATNSGPLYVTVVENNNTNVTGAVALHVVQIGDDRFRGAIKVVQAQNVFDEKINLRHTADFGGNTADTYYQWWVRDVASLNSAGLPGSNTAWQVYAQGLGLNQIGFTGRPDVVLADKLFYVRYGEKSEFEAQGQNPGSGSVSESSWRLVNINNPNDSYTRKNGDPVPFEWAGAANSPQLQADGSLAYIPQLLMGWVKRVLDQINPYEARFSDFADNNAPATYNSLIRSAGAPYIGDIALNSDKNVIENVGLIQLYETILHRAKSLTLDIPGASTEGTDQALLLASTRLAQLYEALGNEAYSDEQDPTVPVTPENGLATAAPYVFAFYNQEATLLDEELALLRGTDFVKAYPVYNRLFWNYVKGLGEAAYNAVYQIGDANVDGFINESDAALAYPQGHGDAWGHFLSAEKMYYGLLRNPAFDWKARSELYSLLDNVIPTDYLDEKSFARIAAEKARTGTAIVEETYREAYTADPAGQWQGYTDPDTTRAWGVSEWSKRAGQGALFDWIVGNALVPDVVTNSADTNNLDLTSAANLDRIDRQANQDDLSAIAAAFLSIQKALDNANTGNNPIGLDPDAITFDIDPVLAQLGPLVQKGTHFEQIYDRAKQAGQNALAALNFASQADQQLSRLNADASALKKNAVQQDLDFRNRLIEIFGTPYEGTIGPGQVYPDGYNGPDLALYLYIDQINPDALVPDPDTRYVGITNSDIPGYESTIKDNLNFASDIGGFANPDFADIFNKLYLTATFDDAQLGAGLDVAVPVATTADYALQAPTGWGRRSAYGRIQSTLNQMLAAENDLKSSVAQYEAYVQGLKILGERLNLQITLAEGKADSRSTFETVLIGLKLISGILGQGANFLEAQASAATRGSISLMEFAPKVNGLGANDLTFGLRGTISLGAAQVSTALKYTINGMKWTKAGLDFGAEVETLRHALDNETFADYSDLLNQLQNFAQQAKDEPVKRLAIGQQIQHLQLLAQDFQSALAEGSRLLDQRSALNKFIASAAQRDRYQDMMLRISRNQALAKYQSAFDNASRYAWLAAKAYEYETALDPNSPASATSFLQKIVKTRQMGNWVDGEPQIGNGGLAEILAQLNADFQTLKGQLGINNAQFETDRLSLRSEDLRILSGTNATPTSDNSWRQALQLARVDDLWQVPEFRQYCRPFADPTNGPQPGIVLEFSTDITPGKNVFGNTLGSGDHAYSTADYATKIRGEGVWLQNYASLGLSASPRVYLVPAGVDRMRISDAQNPTVRDWNVVEQRIPVPFVINDANLNDPNYIPSIDSLDGSFADRRRFSDFRAYDAGFASSAEQLTTTSRLVGRSVWNTRWLLIIPGATLSANPTAGIEQLIGSSQTPGISDILIQFETYSHEGM